MLVVPKRHVENAGELAKASAEELADLVLLAGQRRGQDGLVDGYRLVFNTARRPARTVFHAHLHVLGGGQWSGRQADPLRRDWCQHVRTSSIQSGAPVTEGASSRVPQHTVVVPDDVSMVALLGPFATSCCAPWSGPSAHRHPRTRQDPGEGPSADIVPVERLVDELLAVIDAGQPPIGTLSSTRSRCCAQTNESGPADVLTMNIVSNRGGTIRPEDAGPEAKVCRCDRREHHRSRIGPAGTGKTSMATAKVVAALQAKQVNRIILTRLAVEAGERLASCPARSPTRSTPSAAAVHDALHDMVDPTRSPDCSRWHDRRRPLALHGRTLNSSFIVLDEAQNTTPEQMKMFPTRLGFTQMVVTGDATQVDLPGGARLASGSRDILAGVEDIHFSELTAEDVVRHRLVGAIVDAYGEWDEREQRGSRSRPDKDRR